LIDQFPFLIFFLNFWKFLEFTICLRVFPFSSPIKPSIYTFPDIFIKRPSYLSQYLKEFVIPFQSYDFSHSHPPRTKLHNSDSTSDQ
jgi:hypothetical protein